MDDFVPYLDQARDDIDRGIDIWKSLLTREFNKNVKYIYAKGSAVKPWFSPIDYVPILSDLDIHIMLKKGNDFLHDEPSPVPKSLEISENYESLFTRNCTNSLHLPRVQLVLLNNLLESEDYVPPKLTDVRVIYGEPIISSRPKSERIRKIDYNHLIKTRETLDKLPMKLIDRSGLDY